MNLVLVGAGLGLLCGGIRGALVGGGVGYLVTKKTSSLFTGLGRHRRHRHRRNRIISAPKTYEIFDAKPLTQEIKVFGGKYVYYGNEIGYVFESNRPEYGAGAGQTGPMTTSAQYDVSG